MHEGNIKLAGEVGKVGMSGQKNGCGFPQFCLFLGRQSQKTIFIPITAAAGFDFDKH
jgi:hypothetical protein